MLCTRIVSNLVPLKKLGWVVSSVLMLLQLAHGLFFLQEQQETMCLKVDTNLNIYALKDRAHLHAVIKKLQVVVIE